MAKSRKAKSRKKDWHAIVSFTMLSMSQMRPLARTVSPEFLLSWYKHFVMPKSTELEGVYCKMTIAREAVGVVRLTIEGFDVGELGDAPFAAMAPLLGGPEKVALFVDARRARGPSVDVSNQWALWLADHRKQLRSASILTASPLVEVTANFVRRFAELGDVMRVYTDSAAFDEELAAAVSGAGSAPDGAPASG